MGLLQRGVLERCLTEIGEELCCKGLKWILMAFNQGDTFQEHLLLEALHTLLDKNQCLQPPSTPALIDAISKLENKVNQELRTQEMLMEMGGMLKAVTAP